MQLVVLASGLVAVACGLYLAIGGFGAVPRGTALSIVKPSWLALAGLGLAAVAFSAIWDWEAETITQGSAQAGAGADDVIETTDDDETTSSTDPNGSGGTDDEDETDETDGSSGTDNEKDDDDTTGTTADTCSKRTVPNVIDDKVDDAISAIEAEGLTADSSTAEGTDLVLASDPKAGSSACAGDTVKLTICASATVPAGLKNLPANDALEHLSAKGLDGSVTYEASETVDGGDVIRSEPTSGAVICADDVVTVVVAEKPETCTIPNVEGMTADGARNAIESASPFFSAVVVTERVPKGTAGIGTITQQDKEGNIPCVDTTITLTLTAQELELTNGGLTTEPTVTSPPNKTESG